MPNIISFRLPGRFRWNRWVSFQLDDYGGVGNVGYGRTMEQSKERSLDAIEAMPARLAVEEAICKPAEPWYELAMVDPEDPAQ